MNSFKEVFEQYQWDEIKTRLEKVTLSDVRNSLQKKNRTLDDFLNLLSPAASQELELMATMTRALTQNVLGRRFNCMLHCI
jgi:2-iminoacetate synthase